MADINVERRTPTVWPWVIGLLLLALIVWALLEMYTADTAPSGRNEPGDTATLDTTLEGALPRPPSGIPITSGTPLPVGASRADTGSLPSGEASADTMAGQRP